MSPWIIAGLVGVGTAGFIYAQLVRANGNPTPGMDLGAAAVAGIMIFIVIYTLLKYVLNFE